MRLKSASGGPDMIKALSNQYVLKIAGILWQILDQDFFNDVALFLNTYTRRSQENFSEALNDLRINFQPFPNEDGLFTAPAYVDELIKVLTVLYNQRDDRTVGFLRGAILERLALQLVSQRYLIGECLGNQCFLDRHGKEVTGQIDVAALSHNGSFVEGYECKINAKGVYGLMSEDCDNLKALAKVAYEEGYCVHVGAISFDSDPVLRARLRHFNAPGYIKTYGREGVKKLRDLPQYIEPGDNIEL